MTFLHPRWDYQAALEATIQEWEARYRAQAAPVNIKGDSDMGHVRIQMARSGQSNSTQGEELIDGELRAYLEVYSQENKYAQDGSLLVRTETTTRTYAPKATA